MGCLLAGLVSVPIYLTSAPDAITYILDHAEAHAVFVSDPELLAKVAPRLGESPQVHTVILAEGTADGVALHEAGIGPGTQQGAVAARRRESAQGPVLHHLQAVAPAAELFQGFGRKTAFGRE